MTPPYPRHRSSRWLTVSPRLDGPEGGDAPVPTAVWQTPPPDAPDPNPDVNASPDPQQVAALVSASADAAV